MAIVGSPLTPFPLVTSICLGVPVIVLPAAVPAPVIATMPEERLCMARALPVKAMFPVPVIGPPVIPLLVVMDVTVPPAFASGEGVHVPPTYFKTSLALGTDAATERP